MNRMVWRARVVVAPAVAALVVSGLLAACSEAEREHVANLSQGLSLAVSEPFDVEAMPELEPSYLDNNGGRLACGSERCLVAYVQGIEGTPYLFATRVEQNGSVVDYPRLLLGTGYGFYTAGAIGDEFIAIGYVVGDSAQAWRIGGSDGSVEDITADIPGGHSHSLVGGDDEWLVVYATGLDWSGVVLDRATLAPVGPAFALPDIDGELHVAYGGGQFLLT